MSKDDFGFTIPSEAKTGDQFNAKDHMGNLVAFFNAEKDTFEGDWGPTEIAVCELIVVLDAPDGPELFRDAWVFGRALAPAVFNNPGTAIGVITQKATTKGNPATVLEDPTKAQLKAARKWAIKFLERKGSRWVYLGDESPIEEAPF